MHQGTNQQAAEETEPTCRVLMVELISSMDIGSPFLEVAASNMPSASAIANSCLGRTASIAADSGRKLRRISEHAEIVQH